MSRAEIPLTDGEREAIERHLREKGVTRCPTAFAVEGQGTLTEEERAIHRDRGIDPLGDTWRARRERGMAAGLRGMSLTQFCNGDYRNLSDKWRAKLGLPPKMKGARRTQDARFTPHQGWRTEILWTEEKIATMKRLAAEGHGFGSKIMQAALGCSAPTIYAKARAVGLTVVAPGQRPTKIEDLRAGAPRSNGGTASPRSTRDTAKAGHSSALSNSPAHAGLARRGHPSGAPTPANPSSPSAP